MNLSSQRADLDARRNEVSAFTRSFTDLAQLMNSVTGRKYVVYLSEGFDSSILTGTTDAQEIKDTQEQMSRGGFEKRIHSDKRFGDTRSLNDFEEMLEGFRRADCVVQSVDIGGLRAGADLGYQRQGGTDTLLAMARDTGGDLYQNFNDLGEAMRQMLARTGVTYVLSFQPEEVRRDGSYHELRVELKGQPRGTRLMHRPGYYAPKPYAQMSPAERLLQGAGQLMSGGDSGLLPTAVLAAAARITAADGREVGTGEIRLLDRESGDAERLAATFRPPSLPPGEYRLAVCLTGAGWNVESPSATFGIE